MNPSDRRTDRWQNCYINIACAPVCWRAIKRYRVSCSLSAIAELLVKEITLKWIKHVSKCHHLQRRKAVNNLMYSLHWAVVDSMQCSQQPNRATVHYTDRQSYTAVESHVYPTHYPDHHDADASINESAWTGTTAVNMTINWQCCVIQLYQTRRADTASHLLSAAVSQSVGRQACNKGLYTGSESTVDGIHSHDTECAYRTVHAVPAMA